MSKSGPEDDAVEAAFGSSGGRPWFGDTISCQVARGVTTAVISKLVGRIADSNGVA